jgi:hypothetical protein
MVEDFANLKMPVRCSDIPCRKMNYPKEKLDVLIDRLNWYLENHTDILKTSMANSLIFGSFHDPATMNEKIPELVELCEWIGITPETYQFIQLRPAHAWPKGADPIHVDPQSIARVLLPVRNCEGSINRFYDVPSYWFRETWSEVRQMVNYKNFYKGDYKEFPMTAEFELDDVYLFNISYPHGIWPNPKSTEQRITFTIFPNEDIAHLLG